MKVKAKGFVDDYESSSVLGVPERPKFYFFFAFNNTNSKSLTKVKVTSTHLVE